MDLTPSKTDNRTTEKQDAGAGYNLTLQEVEEILDHFVAAEGNPEVVQFSGGEPTIHPQIIEMMRAAQERNITAIMLNTNGRRIAHDDEFLAQLAEIRPLIYFQFDGFEAETYRIIRGDVGAVREPPLQEPTLHEPPLLAEKKRALDRLAKIGCRVVLVPAIVRGVNEHEIGDIIRFGLQHPAVNGINFQPVFHAGRHMEHDPMQRLTIPDIVQFIAEQTSGAFRVDDFFPVPCCFPTCNSVTYAYLDELGEMLVLPRLLEVDDYLDYVANRVVPDIELTLRKALEGLWSSSAVPGSDKLARDLAVYCAACGLPDGGLDLGAISDRMFMIMLQDFLDPYTFNQKTLMKCCKEILLPDGKQIPFCAYNNVGYREQARVQLAQRSRARKQAESSGAPYDPPPLSFHFGQDAAVNIPLQGTSRAPRGRHNGNGHNGHGPK